MLKDMWKKEISRRKFLKTTGLAVATTAVLTACDTKYLTEPRKLSPADNKKKDHRNYAYTYTEEKVKKINTACYMCAINCAAVGVVDEEGILKRIEPNPKDPVSNGSLCAKGNAGVAQLYDEDRLKTPMRKTGDGTWEEITWDQAFDIMYEEYSRVAREYGPETIFALNRRGYYTNYMNAWLKAIGSPNGSLGQESICDGGKRVAQQLVVGAAGLYCDFKNSKYIMLLGANQMEAPRYRLGMPDDILTAQENGAKLVVVDPRFNYSAAKADEYVPIKTGMDGLFLMSMAHVIIREGLTDKEFIENYGAGFEEYSAEVSKPEYAPEAVAERVGIDADTITRLAIEFAEAESAIADTSSGIIMFQNGTQADWHLLNLVAMTGNMLNKGGIVRRQSAKRSTPKFEENNIVKGTKTFWEAVGYVSYSGRPDGGNRNILADCILNPEAVPAGPRVEEETLPLYDGKGLKACIVYQTDPIGAQTETNRLIEAFNNLEFGVVIDIYLNQSAEALPVGGLVLPEATYLERYASRAINAYTSALALSQAVVEPMWESKSGHWIFTKLGQRFGFADFDALDAEKEEEAMIETVVKADQGDGLFVDIDQLREEGVWMLKDQEARNYQNYDKVFHNGKHYFAFVGDDIVDDHKVYMEASKSPVPTFIEPEPTTDEFPLRFMAGGKVMWHTQTSTRNNKYLMQTFDDDVIIKDKNYIVMSPQDAEARGLETGAMARVSSPTATIEGEVLVTKRVPQGYVHMTHGFGHRAPKMTMAHGVGTNCGEIVKATRTDPYSNTFTAKEEICNVSIA